MATLEECLGASQWLNISGEYLYLRLIILPPHCYSFKSHALLCIVYTEKATGNLTACPTQ